MENKYHIWPFRTILPAATLTIALYFFLVFLLKGVLPAANYCKISVELDHLDTIQLFYWNGIWTAGFNEQRSMKSRVLKANKIETITFKLSDVSVKQLRIDPGNLPGVVKIYRLEMGNHYTKPTVYEAEELSNLLKLGHEGMTMQLHQDYLQVTSTEEDPALLTISSLSKTNKFLLYGLPLFFALFAFTWLIRTQKKAIAPSGLPTKPSRFAALDGLRGLAVVMVIGEHTCTSTLAGLGQTGVWIFMSLTGFFLAKPYVQIPAQSMSLSLMLNFWHKRMLRIMPLYYMYIVVMYLMYYRFDDAVRHLLFIQGSGHLWFIPQVMLFYLLFPLLMLNIYCLFRGRPRFTLPFLALSALVANYYLTSEVFSLYGGWNHNRFFLGPFLSGTFFSYLFFGVYEPYSFKSANNQRNKTIAGIVGLTLFLFFILAFSERPWGGQVILARTYFSWYAFGVSAMIFALAVSEGSFFTKILAWRPFRELGLVSLSLYLTHTLVLVVTKKVSLHYNGKVIDEVPLMIFTLIFGYLLARFLYLRIELGGKK